MMPYRLIGAGLATVALLSILGYAYYEIQRAAVLEYENQQLRIQLQEEKEFNQAVMNQRDADFERTIENAKINATIRREANADLSGYEDRESSELLKETIRGLQDD